jgi:hypothetical protein
MLLEREIIYILLIRVYKLIVLTGFNKRKFLLYVILVLLCIFALYRYVIRKLAVIHLVFL